MIRIDAAHLPANVDIGAMQVFARHDDAEAAAPVLTPRMLDEVCTSLLQARENISDMPVSRVLHAIDGAARKLLDVTEPERISVLHSLRAISGFSDEMAAHVLDRVARDWLAPALEALIRSELGGTDAIESFLHASPARRIRAVAPRLGLHVFSGNVPGVGVTSIVRALLVRSAVLGKSAAGEPALAPAFARLLSRVDPDVGRCVAVTYWRGGDTALEDAALARVGLVVHYGAAAGIAALRARAPTHVRFIEHGPRISFAVIDARGDADTSAVARDLASAVALFDQQGCVSPQLAYVIGTREHARHLADAVAAALEALQHELPRGRISIGEAAAVRELRTRAEFAVIAGGDGELWGGRDLEHTVILSPDPAFEGTCLNRTLLIKYLDSIPALLEAVAPFGLVLQTVGLAGFSPPQALRLAADLADAGATRIVPVADMPWPAHTGHHDGRGPLQEIVRWVDFETSN